jgi:dinuclear metal center YbgI/SA1388 family protein
MEKLYTITKYLDELFDIRNVNDVSWNGLQFEGSNKVEKIVFAVDAGIDIFKKAADENADLIIVHHGLFWKYSDPSICGINKSRTDILFTNNISLYACHLPLDIHTMVGNNIGLLKLLGASFDSSIDNKDKSILVTGLFNKSYQLPYIVEKLNTNLKTKCITLPFGKSIIRKVGAISGSCSYSDISEAIRINLDLLITGECIDVYHMVKDAGINVIFAGHNATETVGIKLLLKLMEKKFNITASFLDIPTGL